MRFDEGLPRIYNKVNAISAYTQLQNEKGENLHGAILAKEIECVKPQAIITLGNPAYEHPEGKYQNDKLAKIILHQL